MNGQGAELVAWLSALQHAQRAGQRRHRSARGALPGCRYGPDAAGFRLLWRPHPRCTPGAVAGQGWSGLSEEYVRRVNSDRPIRLDSRSPSSRSFHQGEPVAIRDVRIEPDFALWAGVRAGSRIPGHRRRALYRRYRSAGERFNGYYTLGTYLHPPRDRAVDSCWPTMPRSRSHRHADSMSCAP